MDEITKLRRENKEQKERIDSLLKQLESSASIEPAAAISQAVENSLSGINITDEEGRIRYANPAAIKMWKYDSIEEVIGRSAEDFFIESEKRHIYDLINLIVRGDPWQGELIAQRKDKSTFPVYMFGTRLVSATGATTGIVASCIDMSDYRRALTALETSEERYRTTLDHLGDSIFLVDRDLTLVYANRRIMEYARRLGIDFSRFVGRPIIEIGIKFDYDYEAELKQVIETGLPLISEGETKVEGKWFQFEKRRIPIKRQGVVTHVVTVLHDITRQKQYEDELKRSEEKYRDIADNVPVGIFIHVDGIIKYGGNETARMLGYQVDELIGTNIMNMIHEDDRAMVAERATRRARGEDMPSGYETRLLRKDGTVFPVLVYGSRIEYLGEPAIQGVFIDISKRKQVERDLNDTLDRLMQSEERYRILVESSNDGIVVVSEANVVFVNRRVLELIGAREEDVIGHPFMDLIHPDDRQLVLENYLKRMSGENVPTRYEFRALGRGGTTIDVEINVVLTEWEGKPSSLYFIRDITDRKIAEQERVRLQDQLLSAQKMEAIGTLAGGMAHNFNNILVGIMGYSEYLLEKRGEQDPDYKALKTIHEGSVKASELTRQLLNIARGGEFKRITVSLNEVVNRVLPLVTGTFNKSIEVISRLAPDLPVIEGDIGQLEQNLLNICINARDAMPDGGRLIIETEKKWIEEEFVKSHLGSRTGLYAVLSVTDTGLGMTPELRDHIFEPFFTTKKHAGGSGMGLATVWGIVKNHGGIITVYSEPGKGSTFKLYFPAIFRETEAQDNQYREVQPGRGETLLLVDDELIIREMWAEILEEIGYHVFTAADGRQALMVLEEQKGKVDLVILDMIMPNMGGKETYFSIRKRYPDMLVLVSSGYSENGQAGEVLSAGGNGFIQKPFQIRQVTIAIRELLEGAGKKT